ncbi:uncharacterized protein L201_007345 [Kwoniella dendrophila CBS 6074]|uniref:Uncharacterized protein n=1 Tax=Kwoniella dendrophila CBS 6074 TaxID=1295534 RepID=A0AAX4K5N0_9TREE
MDAHMPPIGIKQLPPMPYLDEFSAFQTIKVAVNERGNTEKGLEMVATISNSLKLSAEESKAPCRRISFPLKPGMKQAALIVEDGTFEIYKSLTQAKLYLATNINWILEQYGDRYHICKEDVIMVVGTLIARDWAMMISGFRPQTTLTFNVRAPSDRVEGETWGNWTVSYGEKGLEKNMAAELDKKDHKFSCKVSRVLSFSPNAVLLARLKFPPAGLEPTLYP